MTRLIQFFCLLFAFCLAAGPVMKHYGYEPRAVLQNLQEKLTEFSARFDGKYPAANAQAPSAQAPVKVERNSIDPREVDKLFADVNPRNAAQSADPVDYSTRDEKEFKDMIAGLEKIGAVAPKNPQNYLPGFSAQAYRPADSQQKSRWVPPPPGFMTAETFNYLIYRQTHPVSQSISTVLDNIHGNLMLDLTPFTLVIKPNKILVMLFGDKDSYMNFTKRPPWSGASSDLKADTMYVQEGNSFYPLSVHELTHLYFDGYFLPVISPLWLSEGMAVYMQINGAKQKPSWVDPAMKRILQGDIIPLEKMTVTEDLSDLSTPQAELWYTQAYSLVDYLLNTRTRDEFYQFCNELKKKTPLHQALYKAYGMPFTKVSVLQNVWLHDVQKAAGVRPAPVKTPPPPANTNVKAPAKKAPAANAKAAPKAPAGTKTQAGTKAPKK